MPELDIRSRLESATRPAFAKPFDATEDLARGQRARRRRRVREVAVGASASAVAGVAVVAGLPLTGGEDGVPSEDGSPVVSTNPGPSGSSGETPLPVIRRLAAAFSDNVRPEPDPADSPIAAFDVRVDDRISVLGPGPLHDDGESVARAVIRDDVRDGAEPVPLRCADDSAYDTCERRTLDDGTEVVVGQGADDLLAAVWGRDGDLVEATAHWAEGANHNLTLDQLIGLATDDRMWIS